MSPCIRENQQSADVKPKARISCAVTAQLISAFDFATQIVQLLFYLNPKFQASLSDLVGIRNCWFNFSGSGSYLFMYGTFSTSHSITKTFVFVNFNKISSDKDTLGDCLIK